MLAALGAMLGGSPGKAAQLSEQIVSARALASTFDGFAAVTLEEYKDVAKGPTYYDTEDAVSAAVEQAEDEAKRFQAARDRAEHLFGVYNAFVPWVLRICTKRINEVEETLRIAARSSNVEAKASEAAAELSTIIQTMQCLAANVEEASTFLGKMGKTKEGAHDAGVVELASDSVADGLLARHTKARRTKGVSSAGQRTHSGSELEAMEVLTASDSVFFQKQRGAFCGVCAMNNMLGRRAVSYRESELLADSIWLRSVLSDGCGVHFPAPRLYSKRREFPFDGFIDFMTMNKLCTMHGVKLRELNRTKPIEVVKVIKDGLTAAGQSGRTRSRTGNALPLLFILLGSQKHYICLCARRTEARGVSEPAEKDADWDDICRLCGRSGELVCCDGEGCPRAYHPKCVGLADDVAESEEAWLCPDCSKRGDVSGYSGFEHETELLWMDSQIDRPVSERMLTVDRRTAGRNASLFHRFVTAARDCADDAVDPLDLDDAAVDAEDEGGRSKEDAIVVDENEEPQKRGSRKGSTKQPEKPKARPAPAYMRVSERQIIERLDEKNWQAEGHELIGKRVRRYLGGDRVANGKILQWLPAGRDPEQMPVLFRVQHDKTRSKEELGEVEARESVDAAIALGMVSGGGKRGRTSRSSPRMEPAEAAFEPVPLVLEEDPEPPAAPAPADSGRGSSGSSRGGSSKSSSRGSSKSRTNSRDKASSEEEAVGGEGGGGGGGDAAAGFTPLSSDALEELRRALDPSSPEQIVAFAVEIESHHVGDSGKGGAAAVGGGVLEAPEAGGGVMAQGRESDWHRCVDGLQRSGVDVADTEARTWLRRAKR